MGNLLLCEPIIQYDWIFTINWISHIKSNKYRHIVISKKLQTTPREHTPRTTKTSILQGFESICLCLMVCTIGLMGNDTELKSLFGIVFQHRVHRGCPGAASSCLTSHSNRPMRTRKYACSNCCYMTKFLWPTIYVYQPACGDSK